MCGGEGGDCVGGERSPGSNCHNRISDKVGLYDLPRPDLPDDQELVPVGGGAGREFPALHLPGLFDARPSRRTVEVRDGKLRLGVKVERADFLVDPDWRPVAKESLGVADDGTVEITVPANVPSGFCRLQSKGR